MAALSKTLTSVLSPITSLFGGGDSPPPAAAAPALKPPVPMPVADDQSVKDAKRRSLAEQLRRQGRASTILTDVSQGDTLGGGG